MLPPECFGDAFTDPQLIAFGHVLALIGSVASSLLTYIFFFGLTRRRILISLLIAAALTFGSWLTVILCSIYLPLIHCIKDSKRI